MTTQEITEHLEYLLKYVRYSEDAPALREAIEMLKCSEIPNSSDERTDKRTGTHACDCISRQQAIDTIDKALSRTFTEPCGEMILKGLPSAQPEIIFCKDCKYQDEGYRRVSVKWLPCMDVRVPSMWYCGSAERREDG